MMASPGKVQLNLRVAPEIRDACRRLASRAGLSLNLWAEGVLEAAGASDAMVPPEPLPGQTEMRGLAVIAGNATNASGGIPVPDMEQATISEPTATSMPPRMSDSPNPGRAGESSPAACPECAGEMQPYALEAEDPGGPGMTTRCEDCGYWGDGG